MLLMFPCLLVRNFYVDHVNKVTTWTDPRSQTLHGADAEELLRYKAMVRGICDASIDDIDRRLVKTLLVKYLTSLRNGDEKLRAQVSGLLSGILELSNREIDVTGLTVALPKSGGGWLGGMLGGGSVGPGATIIPAMFKRGDESLSEAWEIFLLEEAGVPSLPTDGIGELPSRRGAGGGGAAAAASVAAPPGALCH